MSVSIALPRRYGHWRDQINCCICGRYVKSTADQGTHYGMSHEDSPPDPKFFCMYCARKEFNRVVQHDDRMKRELSIWWQKPHWLIRAEQIHLAEIKDSRHE